MRALFRRARKPRRAVAALPRGGLLAGAPAALYLAHARYAPLSHRDGDEPDHNTNEEADRPADEVADGGACERKRDGGEVPGPMPLELLVDLRQGDGGGNADDRCAALLEDAGEATAARARLPLARSETRRLVEESPAFGVAASNAGRLHRTDCALRG